MCIFRTNLPSRVRPATYRKGDLHNGTWTVYDFRVRPYGYDRMLEAAQWVLDHAVAVTSAVTAPVIGAPEEEQIKTLHRANRLLADCPAFIEETGVIGLGVVMGEPYVRGRTVIKILWYNQTDIIRLYAMGRIGRHYFDRLIENLTEETI